MKATKYLGAFLIFTVGMLTSCTTAHGALKVTPTASAVKEQKAEPTPSIKVIPAPLIEVPIKKPAPKPVALPKLPKNAPALIPVVRQACDELWPTIPYCSFMASKIEQESCISLTHSKCWSPYAELKTAREYGFGLGQITVAYNKNGTERFNVWKDLIKKDKTLKDKWTWENRFDAPMQIRASFIKSKMSFDSIRFQVADITEHMAFGAVTYNSGSVLIDRRLCIDVKGCDPSKWFGNVELYSSKSRIAQKGYGKSFFEISREYPKNILFVRRPKYVPYLDQ